MPCGCRNRPDRFPSQTSYKVTKLDFNACLFCVKVSFGLVMRVWFCCVRFNFFTHTHTHTHKTILLPFFRDHPGEPVPEENFWTLWCKERLTEADTLTIRLGATPSILTSAHLHHPSIFLWAGCPSCHPTNSVKALKALFNFFNNMLSNWMGRTSLKWPLFMLNEGKSLTQFSSVQGLPTSTRGISLGLLEQDLLQARCYSGHPTNITSATPKKYHWLLSICHAGFDDALSSLDKLTTANFQLPIDLAVRPFHNIKDAFWTMYMLHRLVIVPLCIALHCTFMCSISRHVQIMMLYVQMMSR